MKKYLLALTMIALSYTVNANQTIQMSNGAADCTNCHGTAVPTLANGLKGLPTFCLSKYPTQAGVFDSNFMCTAPISDYSQPEVVYGIFANSSSQPSTDVYSIQCLPNTDSLTVSVLDEKPSKPALISIQIAQVDTMTPLSTDAKDGDKVYSPETTLLNLTGSNSTGADQFYVYVNKQFNKKASQEVYNFRVKCNMLGVTDNNIDMVNTTFLPINNN